MAITNETRTTPTIDQWDAGITPTKKGALDSVPETFNFLSPLNFQLILKRAPNTTFDVHKINIPGIGLPNTRFPTSALELPVPGDHLAFYPLVVQFKVDENFNNYIEIFSWLMALGRIPGHKAFQEMKKKPYWTGAGETSELVLTILDSARQVNIVLNYHDVFPTNLSEMIFDAQLKDVEYITSTVQFAYSYVTIDRPI